jgi:hypothetical protein
MTDANTVYCIQSQALGTSAPADFAKHYYDRVTDADSQAFWEAAARVLTDLFERDGKISVGQLFYVSTIYPERVTAVEVELEFRAANPRAAQLRRWSDAADRLCIFLQADAGHDRSPKAAQPKI